MYKKCIKMYKKMYKNCIKMYKMYKKSIKNL